MDGPFRGQRGWRTCKAHVDNDRGLGGLDLEFSEGGLACRVVACVPRDRGCSPSTVTRGAGRHGSAGARVVCFFECACVLATRKRRDGDICTRGVTSCLLRGLAGPRQPARCYWTVTATGSCTMPGPRARVMSGGPEGRRHAPGQQARTTAWDAERAALPH